MDGNTRSATPHLTRKHWQRLRQIYRSAGWPCLDAIELDLLAAGLLMRSADGNRVQLTESGIQGLAQYRQHNQTARSPHGELIQRMAEQLIQGGRICYSELPLRAKLESGWQRVRPDLFSIRKTSREDRLEPQIHEIKVRRADFLADIKRPEKRNGYTAIASRCYYVLTEGVGEATEVPEGFGVWQAGETLTLLREAPLQPKALNFDAWMALAQALPIRVGEGAQQQL